MTTIKCNPSNYGKKRDRRDIKFIVIHYTAGNGDTAKNNGLYFKNNLTGTSAHFFVDRDGKIVKSVPLNYTAWAVGGAKYNTKGGKFYKTATNSNSVSIELCDNLKKDPSEAQIKAVIKVIKYIRKYCVNANYLIRHYDVNGKLCPGRMTDEDIDGKSKWLKFKARVYSDARMDK